MDRLCCRELDLSGNRLRGLPKDLSALAYLHSLDLSQQTSALGLPSILAGLASLPGLLHLRLDLQSDGDVAMLRTVLPRLQTLNGTPLDQAILSSTHSNVDYSANTGSSNGHASPQKQHGALPATELTSNLHRSTSNASNAVSSSSSSNDTSNSGSSTSNERERHSPARRPQRPLHASTSAWLLSGASSSSAAVGTSNGLENGSDSNAAAAQRQGQQRMVRAPQPPPIPLSTTTYLPDLTSVQPISQQKQHLTSPPGSARSASSSGSGAQSVGSPVREDLFSPHKRGSNRSNKDPGGANSVSSSARTTALAVAVTDEDLETIALLYTAVKDLCGPRLSAHDDARLTQAFDSSVQRIMNTLSAEIDEQPPASAPASARGGSSQSNGSSSVVDPFLRGSHVLLAKRQLLGVVACAIEDLLRGTIGGTPPSVSANAAANGSAPPASTPPVSLTTDVRRELARLLVRLRSAGDALLTCSLACLSQLHGYHTTAAGEAVDALNRARKEATVLRGELQSLREAFDEQGEALKGLRDAYEQQQKDSPAAAAAVTASNKTSAPPPSSSSSSSVSSQYLASSLHAGPQSARGIVAAALRQQALDSGGDDKSGRGVTTDASSSGSDALELPPLPAEMPAASATVSRGRGLSPAPLLSQPQQSHRVLPDDAGGHMRSPGLESITAELRRSPYRSSYADSNGSNPGS